MKRYNSCFVGAYSLVGVKEENKQLQASVWWARSQGWRRTESVSGVGAPGKKPNLVLGEQEVK